MKNLVFILTILLSQLAMAQPIICTENSAHSVYGGAAGSGASHNSTLVLEATEDSVSLLGIGLDYELILHKGDRVIVSTSSYSPYHISIEEDLGPSGNYTVVLQSADTTKTLLSRSLYNDLLEKKEAKALAYIFEGQKELIILPPQMRTDIAMP